VSKARLTCCLLVLVAAVAGSDMSRGADSSTAPCVTSDNACGSRPPLPARPDIVVFIADDQPAIDERLLGDMPTVERLFANEGITFTDYHSESPLCCPARAGFLTGQHTHNHGVVLNDAGLLDPAMTIATQLQRVGYSTGLAGKYLNDYGGCAPQNPADCAPTIPAGWDRWDAFSDPDYHDYTIWHGVGGQSAVPQQYGSDPADYSTDVVARLAARQIAAAPPDQALFEWIAPYGPHAPTTPPARYAHAPCTVPRWDPPSYNEADVRDKPAYVRSQPPFGGAKARGMNLTPICRALLADDDAVETVAAALAAAGRLDQTVLVYAGDNGMNEGEHRLTKKQAPYNTLIPFLMRWPAGLGTAPRTIGERLQNIDLAPTLCDLAGCTLGPYPNGQATPDGISFRPLLRGMAHLGRDAVLDEMPAVKTQGIANPPPPWEAVTTTEASPLAYEGCSLALVGGCRWHYVEYADGGSELYDISDGPCWTWTPLASGDPCELVNRIGDPALASIQAALALRLNGLEQERGARPAAAGGQ
jgi:arylsulfatase A-like enzyme